MEGQPQNPQSATQLTYFKSLLKLLTIAIIPATVTLVAFTIFPKNNSRTLSSYTLRCGQKTLNNCTLSQLKPQDNFSLRIDVSAAFANYQDQKPDLCYYINVEPTRKFVPFQKIKIKDNIFYGGCLKNAYDSYKKNSQFAFSIEGKLTQSKLQAKVFLAPSSQNSLDIRITKEAVEIFNLP